MEIGQAYTAQFDNATAGLNGGTPYSIVQIATSASVPVLLQRAVFTCNATASQIQRLTLHTNTVAGGAGTALATVNLPTGTNSAVSPAASSTITYNLTTIGAGTLRNMDSQQWNQLAPYEFNQYPAGLLIPVSSFGCFSLTAAPGTSFIYSFTLEFREIK